MQVFEGNTINPAFHLFQKARDANFVFSYRGAFNAELTSKFVGISEQTLSKDDFKKINRRFSFLLVETFQNILKHGIDIDSEVHGHFSFRSEGNLLVINSINLVSNSQVDELVELVNQINGLNPEQLKNVWKTKLLEGEISEKGGAGLGLIEIARRSGQKMMYRIDDLNQEHKKFHHQVAYVNRQCCDSEVHNLIDKTEGINLMMKACDVLFEFKGIISQKMIFPMMRIVENSVNNTPQLKRKIKTVTHILMEMLQNIPSIGIEDSQRKDGVCVIQKLDNNFVLNTGNIVKNSKVNELKRRLDELTTKSVNELKVMHFNRMTEVIKSEQKQSSQLGLIEIARYSEGKIQYSFHDIGDDLSFFTLRAIV